MQVNSGRDTDRSETAAATSQMSQHAIAAAAAAAAVDNNWPAGHPHAPVQSADRWDRQTDGRTPDHYITPTRASAECRSM